LSSEDSAAAQSHLQVLGLPESFATLQTAERGASSAGTRRVAAAGATAVAVIMSVLLVLVLLLLVLLVVLHVRSECRSCVVAPVAHRALERLLVVMRLHVNLQVVTAMDNSLTL
jgi:hypothetical protein